MVTNFTVVISQRQHFGNQPDTFDDIEPGVPFAGSTKDFSFDCPGVNPNETALLMFRSRDVDHDRNSIQINGMDVLGGLPASPSNDAWDGNILRIDSHYRLRAAGNVLHVESRKSNGTPGDDIDDFIIENTVMVYKIPDSEELPGASGDFAAFLSGELRDSIPTVRGSAADPDSRDQRNQYVLPTASQLIAWRAVFQNLLAVAWGPAHRLARMISSTYNVVQFIDTPTGRTFYVLMEGVPGQIPELAEHPSGSVCITDPADPTRRGWGTYVFAAQPQRSLSISAPHPHADKNTELQAAEAFLALQAHTLLMAGTDRDQNTAQSPCAQEDPPRPFREADVSHTAESVFQMAFEEIYSGDASLWHLQFHGNAQPRGCEHVDVFLSNGVEAAPAMLYTLSQNITNSSKAAADGGSGDPLQVDVYDQRNDCALRGKNNMQMRFASGGPHASICHGDNPQGPSRFIHVEQSPDARSAPTPTTPRRNRDVVLAGICKTFP